MKFSIALKQTMGRIAWDQTPTLSAAEVADLLDQARVPDTDGHPIEDVRVWEPDTAYVAGDRVTDLAGSAYACTQDGISALATPVWGPTVTDGTTAWQRDGASAWSPTYDTAWAASEGWLLKAGKAASMIAFTADGAAFHREQYLAHCQSMAAQWRARTLASVRVS